SLPSPPAILDFVEVSSRSCSWEDIKPFSVQVAPFLALEDGRGFWLALGICFLEMGWWRLFPGIMSLIIVTYGVSSSNHV
ncbi:unnamed protein product, partial [Musa hybrid cultivar]